MSVRFKGQLSGLRVNGTFTKRLDRDLQRLIRQAARAWLREIITRIPIWSGETLGSIKFAQGTDGNLARFLNVSIPINAPYPRPNKNEQTGGTQGQYNFSYARNVYSFFFRSDVVQFILNEFTVANSPTSPWDSLIYAQIAFENYIAENLDRFKPKLDGLTERYDL